MYPSSEPNIVRSLVKFTFRGIFLRSINVPLMQSVPMFMFVNKIVEKKRKRNIVIEDIPETKNVSVSAFYCMHELKSRKRKIDVEKIPK